MTDPTSMWHYQKIVGRWCRDLFGSNVAKDVRIRNFRFLEEALELVQALGCTKDEAFQLVDYVYNRPIGVPFQEVGGTMVTLAALCAASDIDMEQAAWTEQRRCEQPEVMAKIRAKQASKVGTSALPGSGWAKGDGCVVMKDMYASPTLVYPTKGRVGLVVEVADAQLTVEVEDLGVFWMSADALRKPT